jgi:hypothetical protein
MKNLVGISNDSWQGCLTEGKEYEVLAVHGYYVLIEEDSGRIKWNYDRLFELVGEHEGDKVKMEFTVNWNFI